MKVSRKVLCGLASLAVWVANSASATTITDTVDPADTFISNGSTPSSCPVGFTCTTSALSYVHDITDDGFNVVLDIITGATITIHLTEKIVRGENNETFSFDIGTVPQTFTCSAGNCVPNDGRTETITLNVPSLADLQADGKIGVKVTATSGSFFFADSLLTAEVTSPISNDDPVPQVPEPASLLLLGLGLAGLALSRRRKA